MVTTARAGETALSTPSDREVAFTRVFDAPRALVWRTWTEPEHLQKWFLGPDGWTMHICELELRPGSTYRYGWRKDDGKTMEISGEVVEVVPPEKMVTTERWGPEWPEAINTLLLTEKDGRTTVTLTSLYPSKEVRDAAIATGMEKGVYISFDRLAGLLVELR